MVEIVKEVDFIVVVIFIDMFLGSFEYWEVNSFENY